MNACQSESYVQKRNATTPTPRVYRASPAFAARLSQHIVAAFTLSRRWVYQTVHLLMPCCHLQPGTWIGRELPRHAAALVSLVSMQPKGTVCRYRSHGRVDWF